MGNSLCLKRDQSHNIIEAPTSRGKNPLSLKDEDTETMVQGIVPTLNVKQPTTVKNETEQ
jgi:hypothetical protein